jgi:hypothetical protein
MSSAVNPYLRDAPYFLTLATTGVARESNGPENLSHALHLALGVERVLKGILWNVAPAFTLIDESFDNAVKVFFPDRVKSAHNEPKDLKKGANADSVTYRTAATRARIFSQATTEHFAVLMKLGHIRDIVVHNDLALIEPNDVAFFLRGNLYPLLSSFGAEGLVDALRLMGADAPLLEQMSIDYIEDLQARVKRRLAHHRQLFGENKVSARHQRTFPPPSSDQWDTPIICPACEQQAIVREEVDFDYVDRQVIPSGVFISYLYCPYCGLFVEDYEELREMDITSASLHRDDFEGAG